MPSFRVTTHKGAATLVFACGVLFATGAPASAQGINQARAYALGGPSSCIDVPYGDFSAGVRLIVHPCNGQTNQSFVFQDNGHLVANAGQPNRNGVKMCVDTDGYSVFLQPCRRLTTGDRQWWHRDPWGYIQNLQNQCIAIPLQDRAGSPLVISHCAANTVASWIPLPYTNQDAAYDEAARTIAQKANQRPNARPTYDPEIRSAWEDSVRAYGPLLEIKDTRTSHCLVVNGTTNALQLNSCGRAQRFHFSSNGQMREIKADGRKHVVTGRCVTASTREGNRAYLARCNSSAEQRWWLHSFGQVQSQSPSAGHRCLDVSGNSTALGADVITWRCDSNRPRNQAFALTRDDRWTAGRD